MILVDEAIWPYRGKLYCHMVSDLPGEDGLTELHAFAAHIGLKRAWFQGKGSYPHYDVSEGRRVLALSKGAKAVTGRELMKAIRLARSRQG